MVNEDKKKDTTAKINIKVPQKLWDDTVLYGGEHDMKFSACVRRSERLFGAYILQNQLIKEMDGELPKQAKFRVNEHLRIKQTASANKVTMMDYLTTCLELLVYGDS